MTRSVRHFDKSGPEPYAIGYPSLNECPSKGFVGRDSTVYHSITCNTVSWQWAPWNPGNFDGRLVWGILVPHGTSELANDLSVSSMSLAQLIRTELSRRRDCYTGGNRLRTELG